MAASPEPDRPEWPRLVLRRLDQAAAAAVLAVALALLACHWLWHGQFRGRLIEIDRAEPIAIQLQIDVNAADWPDRATGQLRHPLLFGGRSWS
jgi:hypothetical protein